MQALHFEADFKSKSDNNSPLVGCSTIHYISGKSPMCWQKLLDFDNSDIFGIFSTYLYCALRLNT